LRPRLGRRCSRRAMQQPVDGMMESVGARLSAATLASGPATAAEKAFVNEYLVDSSEDEEQTCSAIDAFEKRLATSRSVPGQPVTSVTPPANTKKAVPHHLMHLLDSMKVEDASKS